MAADTRADLPAKREAAQKALEAKVAEYAAIRDEFAKQGRDAFPVDYNRRAGSVTLRSVDGAERVGIVTGSHESVAHCIESVLDERAAMKAAADAAAETKSEDVAALNKAIREAALGKLNKTTTAKTADTAGEG